MNENLHDDFMNLGDMSEIDNRILAEAGQDDLVDRMHEQKQKDATRKAPWMQEVREHWFLYTLLAVSFLLTETLAIYIGLAPHLAPDLTRPGEQVIQFNTDFGHLLTALIYMLVFPLVTEVAFDNNRKKFNRRETGNFHQTWTMALSVVVSVISWIGTGVAGAYVIFSTLGSLGFMKIPENVQTWLVWVIPILLAFFAVMNWLYETNSRFSKSQKMVEEQSKNAELADQMRMKQIEQAGKRAIRAAAIRSYERAVALGLLSQAEADAALAQGMSLADLERKLNRDITGEGKIGDTSGLSRPAPQVSQPSRRNSIIPWHCPKCDNWYVSDVCPQDGTLAPELTPKERNIERDFRPAPKGEHPLSNMPGSEPAPGPAASRRPLYNEQSYQRPAPQPKRDWYITIDRYDARTGTIDQEAISGYYYLVNSEAGFNTTVERARHRLLEYAPPADENYTYAVSRWVKDELDAIYDARGERVPVAPLPWEEAASSNGRSKAQNFH